MFSLPPPVSVFLALIIFYKSAEYKDRVTNILLDVRKSDRKFYISSGCLLSSVRVIKRAVLLFW